MILCLSMGSIVKWMMFIDKVNNIFLENNLALDLERPLFPVENVSNNIL